MNLKTRLKRWYYRFRNSDPVKKCPVYLNEGCSHVDGPACFFPDCKCMDTHLGRRFVGCVCCAYQDSCSSKQFGFGCQDGRNIYDNEQNKTIDDFKKYKILFADLDGTLIDTVSGETFPKGIWDMAFKFNVLDKVKELNPLYLLIVTNQGGIEKENPNKLFEPGTLITIRGTSCVFMSVGVKTNNEIDTFNGFDILTGEPVTRCDGQARLATKKECTLYWSALRRKLSNQKPY